MAERTYTDDETRFLAKVYKDPCSGCWLWTGATNTGNGYGRFHYQGSTTGAHRVSHLLFKGDIPSGLVIDHLCRRRNCVNPDHLEAVTNKVNLNRGVGHGIETHCPQGHPYSPENTCRDNLGRRGCRTCRRIRAREYGRTRAAQGRRVR